MSNKDIKQLKKDAEGRGWLVELTKGGHLKWTWPKTREFFFSASTPGFKRAIKKIENQIRKCELEMEFRR